MEIQAVQGDLTRERVDALVNAANSTLLGGGGVDGALHAAAGPALLEECRRVREAAYPDGLPVGGAVATGAGQLAARWVIHTVGPSWNRGQRDPAQLASCFTRSLDVAAEVGARSVAFPAISAGAYGWAMGTVADVAARAVRGWDAARAGPVGARQAVARSGRPGACTRGSLRRRRPRRAPRSPPGRGSGRRP
jgi:O-acetyl-ADP-ribose deacetylase (regulator of RNase III)